MSLQFDSKRPINPMECKLCKRQKQLRNSHIIPKTFWESVSDDINRSVPISTEKKKLQFVQGGIKEQLLCQDCEVKLSVWEDTLKKDLTDIGNQHSSFLTIQQVDNKLLSVQNIKYEKFKLGALSILWRLSVSNDDHYSGYDLGPYEEKIRSFLCLGRCPKEKEYPLLITQYRIDNKFVPGLMAGFPPGKFETDFTVQKFIIWGHMFLFIVNDKRFPHIPIDCFLRENGNIYIRIGEAAELASSDSAIARIFDEDVKRKMERLRFSSSN